MQTAHADRVLDSVTSGEAAARSKIAASWQRCFTRHRLDPAGQRPQQGPDTARLRLQHEAMGRLLKLVSPRLDDLYSMMGHCGRGIFLTDSEGLILTGRTSAANEGAFRSWGLEAGSDWSEAAQGTNGIGTCLAESRAVTIHRDQHYLPENIGMSCIDAPIFGPDGRLIAALDVSSARADHTDGFNQLIAAMIAKVARDIETDLFRDAYAAHRILLAGEDESSAALLAVDRDDLVVGATRDARRRFELEREGLVRPRPLRDLTGETAHGLEGAERAAVTRALIRCDGNVSAAARQLGIGRATLYRRMKRLRIAENGRHLSRD